MECNSVNAVRISANDTGGMMAYDANFRHINLVYYILQISIPGCPVLWRQKVLTIYIYIYIHPLIAGTNRKAFCCMLALR